MSETEQKTGWFARLVRWRAAHIPEREMMLILAFFIGLFASVAAYMLHGLIRQIQHLLTEGFTMFSAETVIVSMTASAIQKR